MLASALPVLRGGVVIVLIALLSRPLAVASISTASIKPGTRGLARLEAVVLQMVGGGLLPTIRKSSASKAADGFSSAKLAMPGTRGELCRGQPAIAWSKAIREQVQGGNKQARN